MKIPFLALTTACAVSLLSLGNSHAQLTAPSTPAAGETKADYAPQSGQPGKDVVWVPTPQALVDSMLDSAGVTRDDVVVDLGSGDGRTVITAAKRGAKARGIEYNGDMVALARRNAEQAGLTHPAGRLARWSRARSSSASTTLRAGAGRHG